MRAPTREARTSDAGSLSKRSGSSARARQTRTGPVCLRWSRARAGLELRNCPNSILSELSGPQAELSSGRYSARQMMSRQTAARLATGDAPAEMLLHEPTLAATALPLQSAANTVVPIGIAPWGPNALAARDSVNRRLLAAADVVAVTAVLAIVLSRAGLAAGVLAAIGAVPVMLVMFRVAGLYDRDELRVGHSTLDEAPLVLQLTGLLTLGAVILVPQLLTAGLRSAEIAFLWIASFAAILCGRTLARLAARRILGVERCLVIGELTEADRVREKIATCQARSEVIGCLPLGDEDVAQWREPEIINAVIGDFGVDRIIIAGTAATAGSVEVIRAAKAAGVSVSVVLPMFDVVGSGVEFDQVDGMTMLGVPRFGLSRSSRLMKRALDLAASVIGLVVLSPLLSAIALAIRLDSNGPVFFRQTRVGRDGRHFKIVKFRSMVIDADARKDALRSLNSAGAGLFKIREDPRITRVGNFLRSSSLDELPQLVNVLRGDMSLVGPRPLVIDEDAQLHGLDRSRLYLPPGMTGPWQLLRSRPPLQEMAEIDYRYTANWSLWLDITILLRTVGHVLRRGNV
jgi:exopolysaccharide biosynthesis polyprenyl glycosylphosphotransferase